MRSFFTVPFRSRAPLTPTRSFRAEGDWASLLPATSLTINLINLLALVLATPLLTLAGLSSMASDLPLTLAFGVPGLLLLVVSLMGRRLFCKRGLIRINRRTRQICLIDEHGQLITLDLGQIQRIQIETLNTTTVTSWRAVLAGDHACLVLEMDDHRERLIETLAPLAHWLAIPIEESAQGIDAINWLHSHAQMINPFRERARSFLGAGHVRS